ncbi:hypothetical protein CPB86DRAFT_777127 [Serendipita vermifera]|nr:hypothetical protein CPB86DRAFT_777127 [Serendipita vermifera]
MEYFLKNDIMGTLVKLSELDRPSGILAEVLRTVSNMVVLLDEQFLIHTAVHKAIIRLLKACTDDEFQEKVDGKNKVMGAAAKAVRTSPSDYELDLVDLLCVLCSRIRTYRQLLLIFFHDKNWFHSDPNESEDEEDHDSEEEDELASPVDSTSTITSGPLPRKPEYEFLLFNYLLRYVHREGRIGDFARAGVLFLMDVAMCASSGDLRQLDESKSATITATGPDPIADASLALAEYILDGDFADVLGAGLVAVYSVLPSKLEIKKDPSITDNTGAMMLGGNTNAIGQESDADLEKARTFGLESSADPDFRQRLDHFLKIIDFIQDVLRRNSAQSTEETVQPSALVGSAISNAILQAVKTIFMENVLYPSILESSDMDGSAVAVLSYIDMILRTLPDGPLAELIIEFLMSEEDVDANRSSKAMRGVPRADQDRKVRRRKSSAMMLLELEAPKGPRHSSYFASLGRFTLKDLLFSNLRSRSDSASTAVLQLLQTLLLRHPRLTIDRLLVPSGPPEPILRKLSLLDSPKSEESVFAYPSGQDPDDEPLKQSIAEIPGITFTTHERELGLYMSLVSRVDPQYDSESFSTGYDNYLRDAIEAVQRQQDTLMENMPVLEIAKYRLNPNDTLLSLMLQALRTFFAHTAEYNVALTGTLYSIASCPSRSLVGWMTFASPTVTAVEDPYAPSTRPEDKDCDDRSIDFEIDQRLSGTQRLPATGIDDISSRPVLHDILRGLVSQLDRYRQTVDGFEQYLSERRQGLMFTENLTDALNLSIELESDTSFFSAIRNTLSTPSKKNPTDGTSTPPQSKSRSIGSFVPSFFTPKKTKVTPTVSPLPRSQETSTPKGHRKTPSHVSPFNSHYEKTGSISVAPFIAPHVSGGTWTPPRPSPEESMEEKEEEEEEDVFSPDWNAKSRDTVVTKITLSQLLDNVVILEEFMKEMSAIVQARRSLGIDSVRYL